MALTSYTVISGVSAGDLAEKVKAKIDEGQVLVGDSFVRSGAFYQCVGEGTYQGGSGVTDFQMIAASTPGKLQELVADALTATLQPFGEPVVREGALFQVMVNPEASSGGGSYVLPAATTSTLGGVKMTVAVTDLAAQTVTGADAVAVATSATTAVNAVQAKLNALMAALRTAGIQTP